MTDRFTKASLELEEKNAFECETCDDFYGHGRKDHDLKRDEKIGRSEEGESRNIKR